ncbi:hypothetical protein HDU77_001301 [Chytriomyces hyalinus]|nr:hypothetical protein HDU77_001301 [Chytriomyces hyalinus]
MRLAELTAKFGANSDKELNDATLKLRRSNFAEGDHVALLHARYGSPSSSPDTFQGEEVGYIKLQNVVAHE